ncbi:hypothetical protein B0I72DRAFT_137082, partial [Yarrowia lipolytica]
MGAKRGAKGASMTRQKNAVIGATVSMRHRWTSQLASLRQFERSGRPPPIISTPLKPPFISPLLGAKRI